MDDVQTYLIKLGLSSIYRRVLLPTFEAQHSVANLEICNAPDTLILFVQTEGKVFSWSDYFGTVHFTDAPKDPRRSDKIAKAHSGSQTLLRIHRCSSKSTDAPRKFSKI